MLNDKSIRESIFNSFSNGTQRIYATRKAEIYDNSKAFNLILSMLITDNASKAPPVVTVTNQAEQKPKFLNGVKFSYDAYGKPVFEEA